MKPGFPSSVSIHIFMGLSIIGISGTVPIKKKLKRRDRFVSSF